MGMLIQANFHVIKNEVFQGSQYFMKDKAF